MHNDCIRRCEMEKMWDGEMERRWAGCDELYADEMEEWWDRWDALIRWCEMEEMWDGGWKGGEIGEMNCTQMWDGRDVRWGMERRWDGWDWWDELYADEMKEWWDGGWKGGEMGERHCIRSSETATRIRILKYIAHLHILSNIYCALPILFARGIIAANPSKV